MKRLLILLAACGGGDGSTPIDADPAIDAAPPRETITAVQPLAAGELVEGIMTGGPADHAVIHLEAPSATLDWNLHGHAGGGTQELHDELGKMTVDYTYTPETQADWFLLLRNGGTTNMDVRVRVDLYGAMTWRWQ